MGRPSGVKADEELATLLRAIDQTHDPSDVPTLLAELLAAYDLKSFAYLGSGVTAGLGKDPYLAVTYSPEWVEHYKAQHFVDIDPAIQIGMRRMLSIDWSEFDRQDAKVRRLFGEASEFGLGRQGISLPVHGHSGDRALISITSDATDKEWRNHRLQYIRDFQILALHLHQAILRLEGLTSVPTKLSPRERECLLWIAEGKSAWETATILGLKERTVRFYLESARHKLGAANTTHAVIKAGKASLLTQLP